MLKKIIRWLYKNLFLSLYELDIQIIQAKRMHNNLKKIKKLYFWK